MAMLVVYLIARGRLRERPRSLTSQGRKRRPLSGFFYPDGRSKVPVMLE